MDVIFVLDNEIVYCVIDVLNFFFKQKKIFITPS